MQMRMNSNRRNTLSSPTSPQQAPRRRNTRAKEPEDDDELRRAIEASKRQADEDERKRKGVQGETDDDLAWAIKLSKEEEDLRKQRVEGQNADLLFDDSFDSPAPQPVYQQQQEVDFWGTPVDMTAQQQQQQSTGYLQNVYSQPTGVFPHQTGYLQPQQPVQNGFAQNLATNNPYAPGQFAPQPVTGFTTGSPAPSSNNPYGQQQVESLQPMPTGSNNPFAQFGKSFDQSQSPQQQRPSFSPSLSMVTEQPQQFSSQQSPFQQQPAQTFQSPPPKPPTVHQNRLDFLIGQGNPMGQDTFGNTGELRVPAHYQRTGYVNSAGQGLRQTMTGTNNPFAGQQGQQGVRPLTNSSTGPGGFQQGGFGQYGGQGQGQKTGSLIDL
jgi:epsin